jgi:hypothetical protein
MTKNTPPGIAGNVKRAGAPLRQWASQSYSASNGRPVSSLGVDQSGYGSPSATHCENPSRQIPSGFEARDRRATTDPRPVRTREFTKQVD